MKEQRIVRLREQLRTARARLSSSCPTEASDLYELTYVATKAVDRISTNGHCIYFDPDWFQTLGEAGSELILMHQVMHLRLGHIDRPLYYRGDRFHLACDIIANAHLFELGWQYDRLPHIGRIYRETFFPKKSGKGLSLEEAMACVPFDPAELAPGVRRTYRIDSDEWWDRKEDRGEGGTIILLPGPDTECVFDECHMGGGRPLAAPKRPPAPPPPKPELRRADGGAGGGDALSRGDAEAVNRLKALRNSKVQYSGEDGEGDLEDRYWRQSGTSSVDWRSVLDVFLQDVQFDYSFTPPDRRAQDADLFLPDFNAPIDRKKTILFLVDTSGSVDDGMLRAACTELCSVLEQFQGSLMGLLGFFDTQVYDIRQIESAEDLHRATPVGGGGTDYSCIFDHVYRKMAGQLPDSIVIFTDGRADFPEHSEDGIPVLWLLSQKGAAPPWGKSVYMDMAAV